MTLNFNPAILFGLDPKWVSLAVLAVTYAAVISGRINRAVVALIGAVIVILIGAHLTWGRSLHASRESGVLVMGMNAPGLIGDWVLLRRSCVIMALVLAVFVLARPLGLEPATVALTGAAALMLLDNWRHRGAKQADNVHATFADVDWTTIFFFLGLVVVVHAIEVSGLLAIVAGHLVRFTGGQLGAAGAPILWISAFLSARSTTLRSSPPLSR